MESTPNPTLTPKPNPSPSPSPNPNQVGVFGPMESVRIEHDKGEAFVAFLDAQAAAMLLQVLLPSYHP